MPVRVPSTPAWAREFYEDFSAFRAAFDSAALEFDLHRVCFEDPDGVLNQTEYTQPCMVAFACGVSAVLAQQGVQPSYVAGLSLGEYSALEAAGVFTAKQAIELAAYRGKAMADAAKGIDCGMTAVLNLDRDALAVCCKEASALGCVQICNYNCPGQLVIGGEKAAVDKAAELAKGRRCPPLHPAQGQRPLPYPPHGPCRGRAGQAVRDGGLRRNAGAGALQLPWPRNARRQQHPRPAGEAGAEQRLHGGHSPPLGAAGGGSHSGSRAGQRPFRLCEKRPCPASSAHRWRPRRSWMRC